MLFFPLFLLLQFQPPVGGNLAILNPSAYGIKKLILWKQPKCPSRGEWIKKMWRIYTMEYDSAIKRNETELFVTRWMDLGTVIQSEVSQKEKNKYHMLTHIYTI